MSGQGDAKRADPREEGAELSPSPSIRGPGDDHPLRTIGRTLLFGGAAATLPASVLSCCCSGPSRAADRDGAHSRNVVLVPYPITAIIGLVVVGGSGFVLLRSRGRAGAKKG